MRKTIATLAAIFAAVTTAAFGAASQYVNRAYPIDGTNSFTAGAYSGLYSRGNFNTAVGCSSFRQTFADNSTAIGNMAMTLSGGGDSNVMVGDWAGYGSSNLNHCVGIGSGAFSGARGVTNGTSINGQIVVRGDQDRFWITPDRTATANWDGCPPIYYNAGTLYLNARQIVKRDGVVETRAPLWTSDWNRSETNAIYVAGYGSDEYSGASAYYPKRTLQAAIMALTNDTTTIYVDRGVYESPAYLDGVIASTSNRISIVGVGRCDEVVIDCGDARKISAGSSGYFCAIKNATIRNPKIPQVNAGANNRAALQLLYLENCRIEGTNAVVRNSQWLFHFCALDACEVDFGVSTASQPVNTDYSVIFETCGARGSVMRFRTLSTDAPNFAYGLKLEGCFVDVDRLDTFHHRGNKWQGEYCDWTESTIIVGAARTYNTTSGRVCTNSVLGYGNDGPGQNFASFAYRTSATNLTARLDAATHRPAMSDFDLLPFGYNSAADRAVRDAAAATVIDALVASGTITQEQSAALTARRAELVARNAVEPMKLPDPAEPVTAEADAQED